MPCHIHLRHHLAGSFAVAAFAAATAVNAQAADLTITDAKIEAGRLVVTGTTATPSTWVRLDGQLGTDFNVKSGADGAFAFGVVYHPGDCIVGLQKLVSPTTLGASTAALVADCGPAGVSPRGAWKQTADYVANDLATYQGSTWRARRTNSGKQPAEGADWEIFAAGATSVSQQAGGTGDSGGVPTVAPTGPAGGDLSGTYPNPQIALGTISTGDYSNSSITGPKIQNFAVGPAKLATNSVGFRAILDESIGSAELGVNSVDAAEIAANAVGSSEIADDAVGSSEIGTGAVTARGLGSNVHEHFGSVTDITDTTAHDGAYSTQNATVTCGANEILLSVSVDWTATGGHNELVFSGVNSISRAFPQSAVVRVAYDGGATIAKFQPVATCIF